MSASETAPPRDRYLAFAFAGADLLVEASPDGIIRFAAGAFRLRLGRAPEDFIGRHLRTLVAAPDRAGLGIALAALAGRGRIPPMVMRLNTAGRTPSNFAALLLPGSPPRLCASFGPVPIALASRETDEADRQSLARETEAWLRDGGGGGVALLEVHHWAEMQEALTDQELRALQADIGLAIGAAAARADGTAQDIADGRYGVLLRDLDEASDLVRAIDTLVRGRPAGQTARVEGLGLSLGAGVLAPSQAARALRFALSRFRAGGIEAARAIGGDAGLAGVLAATAPQAESLRAGIAGRHFVLQFQPVVSLLDRTTHHFESLLRPEAQLIGPGQTMQDFVLSVEAMGLTEELDAAVAELALATLRARPEVAIAINVFGLSIESARFGERIVAALGDPLLGGPEVASRLLIEVTETVQIDDIATAASNIAAFRSLGARLCLDDFGAGDSAFRYLRAFQVDFVKINGGYVRRARLGPRERSFVAAMVELANEAGAEVIAMMVETEEEAQLMRLLGVGFGQGWLLGRPGPLPGTGRA